MTFGIVAGLFMALFCLIYETSSAWFTWHGRTLHTHSDERAFKMPVYFGELYFLHFCF